MAYDDMCCTQHLKAKGKSKKQLLYTMGGAQRSSRERFTQWIDHPVASMCPAEVPASAPGSRLLPMPTTGPWWSGQQLVEHRSHTPLESIVCPLREKFKTLSFGCLLHLLQIPGDLQL